MAICWWQCWPKWVSEQFLNGTSPHNRPFQCRPKLTPVFLKISTVKVYCNVHMHWFRIYWHWKAGIKGQIATFLVGVWRWMRKDETSRWWRFSFVVTVLSFFQCIGIVGLTTGKASNPSRTERVTIRTAVKSTMCGLLGIMRPWFNFSFWRYIYCLLVYIVCFPSCSFLAWRHGDSLRAFHDEQDPLLWRPCCRGNVWFPWRGIGKHQSCCPRHHRHQDDRLQVCFQACCHWELFSLSRFVSILSDLSKWILLKWILLTRKHTRCIPKPHRLLSHLNPDWFYLSGTGLPRFCWKRGR